MQGGKIRNKTVYVSLIILVLASAATTNVGSPSEVVKTTVDPTPVTAKVGTTFTVAIKVEDAPPDWWGVWSWQARFEWNASILTFVSTEEGPFLKEWAADHGTTTLWMYLTGYCEEHELNYVLLYCTLMPGGTLKHGRGGSGHLAYVNFTVAGTGSSILLYHNPGAEIGADTWLLNYEFKYIGSLESGVTFVAVNGEYVTILGDIDGDGDVDRDDLYILSEAYGTSPPSNPKCDLDRDGDVDLNDLYILSRNYLKDC